MKPNGDDGQGDAVEYLESIIRELAKLSKSRRLHFVSYLLEMALEELLSTDSRRNHG